MSESKMCYAISYPGKPGYGTISADVPEMATDNAKLIARAIRNRGTVHRITTEQAKAGMLEYFEADK